MGIIWESQRMHKKISSWVRQSRHRAKNYKVITRLEVKAIQELINELNGLCAYCLKLEVFTLDNAFPISDGAPNVLANILPACQDCKHKKGNRDLIAIFSDGQLSRERYLTLLKEMLDRDGKEELRNYIKGITGVGL